MTLGKLVSAVAIASMLPVMAYAEEGSGPEVGHPAPSFIGRTLDDKSYRLKNDKGRPKVINFFWVECIPCRQEMPELAKLEKQYTGVKFISVHTVDARPEVVVDFLKKLSGAPSNIVLTSGGLQETFNYRGLPHTMVLDGDNVVVLNLSGFNPDNMRLLNKAVQQLAKH